MFAEWPDCPVVLQNPLSHPASSQNGKRRQRKGVVPTRFGSSRPTVPTISESYGVLDVCIVYIIRKVSE